MSPCTLTLSLCALSVFASLFLTLSLSHYLTLCIGLSLSQSQIRTFPWTDEFVGPSFTFLIISSSVNFCLRTHFLSTLYFLSFSLPLSLSLAHFLSPSGSLSFSFSLTLPPLNFRCFSCSSKKANLNQELKTNPAAHATTTLKARSCQDLVLFGRKQIAASRVAEWSQMSKQLVLPKSTVRTYSRLYFAWKEWSKLGRRSHLKMGVLYILGPTLKNLSVSWFPALARNLFYNKFEISSHWFDCLEEKNIEDQSKTPISSA